MTIRTVQKWTNIGYEKAFALPVVLIASVVMLAVLTVTLASVQGGVTVALNNSHYNTYAKSAAQSGLVMAKACLKASDYSPTWSANPLRPNTSCTGAVQSGLSPYLHVDDANGLRSTFIVDAPTSLSNGVQRLTVNAKVERIRQSTGEVIRTYTSSGYATLSTQANFDSVAFGYTYSGVFFGAVGPQGEVSAVGYNGDGQLGNTTTANSTSPQPFILPDTLRAKKLYSNFLSAGYDLFAITTDGQLYGAGLNSSGQLGNASTATAQTTPVKFQLPAGVKAVYAAPGLASTYVIGDDNNIYSAGACTNGILGYGYTIAGCANQSTYKRVALPAVNLSDPNTLPVPASDWVQSTNLTTDLWTAYARMQGGKVYGWGQSIFGQLGTGSTTNSATPVQITALGNTGQPKATQVAFDGDTAWILDDTGSVWSTGSNHYGATGAPSAIGTSSGKCLTNTGNSTVNATQLTINTCDNSASQLIEWAEDGSLRFRPNASTVKCIDNSNGYTNNANPIGIYTCNGTTSQVWVMNDVGKLVNPFSGKCIDNPNNSPANGTGITLYDCNPAVGFPNQTWPLMDVLTPRKSILPAGHGTVKRITTDQWSVLFLMTDGTVWGYGLDNGGQLGSGSLSRFNPRIKQFILPAGRTAVNFYTSKSDTEDTVRYANTFAILDDGSIYGSGANVYGQLGIGTTTYPPTPTPVKMALPAGVRAKSVQYGYGTTVVLSEEGRIYTVGSNATGQLGDGTTTNSSTPQARKYVNTRPVVLY